jgi:hypothetical protein
VSAMTPKMMATWRMMAGTPLLWVALAALAHGPTTGGGLRSVIVACLGFFSFTAGLALFADGLKREIVQQLRREQPAIENAV